MLVLTVYDDDCDYRSHITLTIPPSDKERKIRVCNCGRSPRNEHANKIGIEADHDVAIVRSDAKDKGDK